MTSQTWIASVAVAVALVGGWMIAAWRGPQPVLRSAHAEPATRISGRIVVVTTAGKIFHLEGCTFIHGPAMRETDGEAIAAGYTPCTRCLPR